MIALVPQTAGEGQAYLKKLGVDINDVRQVSFGGLGVSGTPTLILVDGGGKVAAAWVGALPADKEDEVISRLHPEQARRWTAVEADCECPDPDAPGLNRILVLTFSR